MARAVAPAGKGGKDAGAPESKAEVLAPGAPPLTREMMDRYSELFEWAFDVQLTAEQRAQVKDFAVQAWQSKSQENMDAVLEQVKTQQDLSKTPKDELGLLRQQIEPQLLTEYRREAKRDAMARWAVELYEVSHKVIAKGPPPLTRQMTDAYAEALCFAISEGAVIVRALLEQVSDLKILITSRQLLGLAGEREFVVPPLIVAPVIAPPPKSRKSTTTTTNALTRPILFVAFMRLISFVIVSPDVCCVSNRRV